MARQRTYGFSFSLNRALGISAFKGKIARATGIPTTRSGRERKIGRLITQGVGSALGVAAVASKPQCSAGGRQASFQATSSRSSGHSLAQHDSGSRGMLGILLILFVVVIIIGLVAALSTPQPTSTSLPVTPTPATLQPTANLPVTPTPATPQPTANLPVTPSRSPDILPAKEAQIFLQSGGKPMLSKKEREAQIQKNLAKTRGQIP